jgi:hypothetical protein
MPFSPDGEAIARANAPLPPTEGFPVHEKAPSRPHPNNNPPKGGGLSAPSRPLLFVKSH